MKFKSLNLEFAARNFLLRVHDNSVAAIANDTNILDLIIGMSMKRKSLIF